MTTTDGAGTPSVVSVPATVVLVETRTSFPLDVYQLLGFVHSPTGEVYDPFVDGWRPGIHQGRLKFIAFGGAVTSEGSSVEVAEDATGDGFVFSVHNGHRVRVDWDKLPVTDEAYRVGNALAQIRLDTTPQWAATTSTFTNRS